MNEENLMSYDNAKAEKERESDLRNITQLIEKIKNKLIDCSEEEKKTVFSALNLTLA